MACRPDFHDPSVLQRSCWPPLCSMLVQFCNLFLSCFRMDLVDIQMLVCAETSSVKLDALFFQFKPRLTNKTTSLISRGSGLIAFDGVEVKHFCSSLAEHAEVLNRILQTDGSSMHEFECVLVSVAYGCL